MTTAADIIQAAMREGNLIPVGQQPTDAEQTEALGALNRFVESIYGYELGEYLTDWLYPAPQRTSPVAANYPALPYPTDAGPELFPIPYAVDPDANIYPYPPANSRIIFGSVTGTVYFPESPSDGSRMALVQGSGAGDSGASGQVITLDGNGRTIGTQPTQAYTSPVTPQKWFYRADLADWVPVATMAVTDDIPFPSAFDDFFVCALAMRLAPRYGKTPSPATVTTAQKTLLRLKAHYAQTAVTVYKGEDIPRALEGYLSGIWYW